MNWEEVKKWLRYEDLGEKIFPREVGIYRDVARDDIEFMMYVVGRREVDCYSSIFSNWQISRRYFDLVFLDVDDHDGGKDLDSTIKEILDVLGEEGCRIYFTGRGYHVFYYFPLVRIEHYGDCVRRFLDECDVLSRVDRQVVGDYRRLARIPGTINGKVSRRMVLVREYGGYCDWWQELIKIDKELGRISREDIENVSIDIDLDIKSLPKCIRQGLEILIKTGELEHTWRLALAIFLLKVVGVADTKRVFELFASDYNESKTMYQLRWLVDRKYKCFSCRKMKDLGICPYDDMRNCPWYVVSGGWLEKVVENDNLW